MSEASERLKARTENFAASTSVAANYRAACRGYTRPIFVAKLAIVAEEADESELWLRILRRTGLQTQAAVGALEQEAHELASIFTASLRTARGQRKRPSAPPTLPTPPNLQSGNNL